MAKFRFFLTTRSRRFLTYFFLRPKMPPTIPRTRFTMPPKAAAKKDKNHVNIIRNQATAGVEVTLDASELENMDESMLKEKYEDTVASAKQAREDVSDVFEEQAKKRAKKDKGKGKDGKKYKEYAWG